MRKEGFADSMFKTIQPANSGDLFRLAKPPEMFAIVVRRLSPLPLKLAV